MTPRQTDPTPLTPRQTDRAPFRLRRPVSLQTGLMVTVIGIVALILVAVALATSAILGNILSVNLNNRVQDVSSRAVQAMLRSQSLTEGPATAYSTLDGGRFQPGTLIVLESAASSPLGTYVTDGAYVTADGDVAHLTSTQLKRYVEDLPVGNLVTTSVPGLGTYRTRVVSLGNQYLIAVGLPLSDVNSTIAQILTTVALVTLGGLVVLGATIAILIRRGLAPLRAIADTATHVASLPLAEGRVSISERVPTVLADERTEIGKVGAALNTLLDHVSSSLDARQRNEARMRSFVADASHELRTPLASIRGYSELSLRDRTLSVDSAQALERIQAQSLRMTTLVEDLLLLARLEEGQELVYGTVDLTQLAIEAVGDARPAGRDHAWVIDVAEEPITIAGDESRLHQVVANLLANARAHTPAGTTVTVSTARDGAEAVLRVHDDGPGVDPAIAGELFERFSRADRSRARQTGGTGLGLSIARAIVEAHHGSISVTSVPGDTVFEVRLPARPADPADGAVPRENPQDQNPQRENPQDQNGQRENPQDSAGIARGAPGGEGDQ